MQRKLVKAYVRNGGNGELACKTAGYAEGTSPWQILQSPLLMAAVRAERERVLELDFSTVALGTLRDIMQDEEASPAVRAKVAMWAIDRAHPSKALQGGQAGSGKPLNEMTLEELTMATEKAVSDLHRLKQAEAVEIHATTVPLPVESEPTE